MNKKLDSVEWREFIICDIFKVSGTTTTHPSKLQPNGTIPRITCAATNNGFDNVYTNEPTENGGVLTIDSATTAYIGYQEKDFIATDHVEKVMMKNSQRMNRYVGLFIKTMIDKACIIDENTQTKKYLYGYKFSQKRIKRQIIKLPIDSQGQPNYDFMEKFMRQIEQRQIKNQLKTIKPKLAQSIQCTFDKNAIKWKEFKISQIFKNYHGKRLIEKDRIFGSTPLLTAGESNNGITSFIENKQMKIYKDFISIDMFGNSFYHSYNATGDDNIYFFVNDTLSHKTKLFIVACINMQKSKYSYGKQFRQSNANNTTIMLPTDSNGNPHYDFMESTMQQLEQKHLKRIFNYYTNKLNS